MPKIKIRWIVLAIALSLPLAAGFAGSLATTPNIPTWYATLNKPFFNLPNWLFAPVWTTLYLLMGYASYLVYSRYQFGPDSRSFFRYYLTQLLLNTTWSLVFFGLQSPPVALLIIIFLWYLIYRTLRLARPLVSLASYLLYPYLFWVSFATLLNLSIVMLN